MRRRYTFESANDFRDYIDEAYDERLYIKYEKLLETVVVKEVMPKPFQQLKHHNILVKGEDTIIIPNQLYILDLNDGHIGYCYWNDVKGVVYNPIHTFIWLVYPKTPDYLMAYEDQYNLYNDTIENIMSYTIHSIKIDSKKPFINWIGRDPMEVKE